MAYSWGDDTSTWKNPGTYDYGSAKRAYVDPKKKMDPRTYQVRNEPNFSLVNPKGKDIVSESENPVIVGVDVTGSMADWPGEIFDRLPLFCQTLAKFRPDVEISFSAIGDAYSDSYPLQVGSFGKGVELDKVLNGLFPEGGGGGQHFESYDLWAYYMAYHCSVPKAVSPFMILMGDESFYEKINTDQVKYYVGDKLEKQISTFDIWKELGRKFNLYLLHKEYDSAGELEKEIVSQWQKAIGKQHVIAIPCKERAVDVALGIIARSWGRYEDFMTNLSARQEESEIAKVVSAIGKTPSKPFSLYSKTFGSAPAAGGKSNPLV